MAVTLSVADFRTYFGIIFADTERYPDPTIQMQLDEAMIEVCENVFKKYYRRAAYYLTAHFLTLWRQGVDQFEVDSSGSATANSKGVISSVSVGDLSLTMEMPEYSTSSDDKFLASTIFGQEFIRLRNKMSRGTLLANKVVPVVGVGGCCR